MCWLQHPPKKSGDSRAPLGLRRPRGVATPIRTAALRRAGERTGVGAPTRRGGSVNIALPGTARLVPGVARNSKPFLCILNSTHVWFCPPQCELYSFRAQNKVERLSPVDPGISRGVPDLYPSRGYTHLVAGAIEVSRAACKDGF